MELFVQRLLENHIHQIKNNPEEGPLYWEFPGGHMEQNIDQSPVDAAIRETLEETGINVEYANCPDLDEIIIWKKENQSCRNYIYFCKKKKATENYIQKNKTLSHEVQNVAWVTFRKAFRLMRDPNNKDYLKYLKKVIKKIYNITNNKKRIKKSLMLLD